jgi:two-component system, response regulator PdtaR
MTRSRLTSFRGARALILHRDSPDRATLQRHLLMLGLSVATEDNFAAPLCPERIDVLFYDLDSGATLDRVEATLFARLPTIALVGSETPSRLEWMLQHSPSAYLMKPIRPAGIFTCLAVAIDHHRRVHGMEEKIDKLGERLRLRRALLSAVLRLMRELDVSEKDAYRLLQRAAMTNRTTIEALGVAVAGGQISTRAIGLSPGASDLSNAS